MSVLFVVSLCMYHKGPFVTTFWAVVVAKLVERLLPTPEVRALNPVIGKIFIDHSLLSTVLKRQK